MSIDPYIRINCVLVQAVETIEDKLSKCRWFKIFKAVGSLDNRVCGDYEGILYNRAVFPTFQTV
jgi:hypothetical protein